MAVPMTQEGYDNLKNELDRLEALRPKKLEEIKLAREKGDLKENAEYHAAREDLAMMESKIADLNGKLSQAEIVDKSKIGGDEIVFGATVTLQEEGASDEEEYTLVGEGEADVMFNKILTTSPMGQALLNKKVGDLVEVPVPKGTLKFKVLKIAFE